jgi:hypothetical protein
MLIVAILLFMQSFEMKLQDMLIYLFDIWNYAFLMIIVDFKEHQIGESCQEYPPDRVCPHSNYFDEKCLYRHPNPFKF